MRNVKIDKSDAVKRLQQIAGIVREFIPANNSEDDNAWLLGYPITNFTVLKAYIDMWSAQTGMTDDIKISLMKKEILAKEIPDKWTDTEGRVFYNPMVVADVRMWKGADYRKTRKLHLGVMLMRKYATSEGVSFDCENIHSDEEVEDTAFATEKVAKEGVCYYGLRSRGGMLTLGANLSFLQLSVGDKIPYSSYETVYKNEVRDTSARIIVLGHNLWRESAYRQWLNSTAPEGTSWWKKHHVGQTRPPQATKVRGYLQGVSGFSNKVAAGGSHATDGLWKYMKPVYILTKENRTTGIGISQETLDLMWLPTIEELQTGGAIYGEEDICSPRFVVSRSPYQDNSHSIRGVNENGFPSFASALYKCAATPACVIY